MAVIGKLSTFLETAFPGDKIERLVHHVTPESLKNNDEVNMKPPKGAVSDEVVMNVDDTSIHE